MTDIQQVRKGSTPLLILSILVRKPMHGYAIMRELEARSQGYFTMNAALLYPALHQMEQDGLVQATWEGGQGQRRRRIYAITPDGSRRLAKGQDEWQTFFTQLFEVVAPLDKARSEP